MGNLKPTPLYAYSLWGWRSCPFWCPFKVVRVAKIIQSLPKRPFCLTEPLRSEAHETPSIRRCCLSGSFPAHSANTRASLLAQHVLRSISWRTSPCDPATTSQLVSFIYLSNVQNAWHTAQMRLQSSWTQCNRHVSGDNATCGDISSAATHTHIRTWHSPHNTLRSW